MALLQRPSAVRLRVCSVVIFVMLAALAAAAAAGETRITAVSNATLRALPLAGAEVVAQVPLGTELAEAGPAGLDKTWIRVRLADGREGWLLASLTRPLDAYWRWPVFDAIIESRLARAGDGFQARVELVQFIERVAPEYVDADGRARVELARLRAIAAALDSIPAGGASREPYASWLAARRGQVVHDEPGGRWILAGGPIWELHARLAGTSSADDIAWFAVTNGLPGECEGYVFCYVDRRNRLHGEYLRREPDGRHSAEAVGIVRRTAELLAAPAGLGQGWQFDRGRDCRDLVGSVDALIEAVKATGTSGHQEATERLSALRAFCR
jgi:hypothetical protein